MGLKNKQTTTAEYDGDTVTIRRLTASEWSQLGEPIEGDTNRIRKHEFTRPDKEADRVRQIHALNAPTGPVFLTYRHSATVDRIAAQVTAAAPLGVRVQRRNGRETDHHAARGKYDVGSVSRAASQFERATDDLSAVHVSGLPQSQLRRPGFSYCNDR